MPRPRSLRPLLLIAGLALLAACSDKGPAEEAPPAAPVAPAVAAETAAPSPVPALPRGTLEAVALELGAGLDADGRVAQVAERFRPRDTVHASLVTVGEAPAAMLSVQWRSAEGRVLAADERAIQPKGPAVHTFSRQVTGGWPPGRYEVEVRLNGESAGVRAFEVR
ncbi:MAG: hypothetical protein KatS3mg127_2147 [Silanimonas sp.]|nr:MAG: hypothetical protein KatS3mg127_2147 [Silanimonas sp.]